MLDADAPLHQRGLRQEIAIPSARYRPSALSVPQFTFALHSPSSWLVVVLLLLLGLPVAPLLILLLRLFPVLAPMRFQALPLTFLG